MHSPALRWDIWWRWVMISVLGIIVANVLYRTLPNPLLNPSADETIWLKQPWRVVVLSAMFYTPISLAQWFVLRRYVSHAWWWLTITLGSVVVIYPAIIWLVWSLGQWDLASDVWFFGLGGGSIYIVAQWAALLRWTRNVRIWGICFVLTSICWLVVLSAIALLNSDLTSHPARDGGYGDILQTIILSSLYQLTIGGVLATILQPVQVTKYR